MIFAVLLLTACGESEEDIYALLMEAEDLSGMKAKMGTVISEDGDLGLPKEYNGVEITYKSRNPDIISDDGIVTLPENVGLKAGIRRERKIRRPERQLAGCD